MRARTGYLLVVIAIFAFLVGSLVYVLDRPAVYLLPDALSFSQTGRSWFGAIGGRLPGLAHVYAFILLTVAVSPRAWRAGVICIVWWLSDSLFEIGQHPEIAPHIAAALPQSFQHVPILDHIASYFLNGTFDVGDLLAIALGSLLGYFTIGFIRHTEVGHATDMQVRSSLSITHHRCPAGIREHHRHGR